MSSNSQERFIGQVNSDNETTLTPEDVIFGSVADTDMDRSQTRIVATPGSGYRGGVTLRYRRLRLSKLFGFFQPKVPVPDGAEPTPELLIASVKANYGITLDPLDVTISRKTLEEGDFFVVEAKDTSLVYSDTADFMLQFNQLDIETVIGTDSQSYVYPTEQLEEEPRKIDGFVYAGGWVVPEASVELSEFLVGQEADHNLMWLTQTLSGESWYVDNNPGEHNLFGALVDYNGPISGYALIPDEVVTVLVRPTGEEMRVLALKPDPAYCTDFVGCLTYYY